MGEARKKILFVEGDRKNSALLAEDLTERGFIVDVSDDGAGAFSTIIWRQPDLVLCALSAPGTAAFDLLRRLTAAAPLFSNMPFIFLSAIVDRHTELKARRLGADDFITEPVDLEILGAIVASRLARMESLVKKRADISSREIEALTWAARGKTSAEIAIIMKLSKRTVDFYFGRARLKLHGTSRADTVMRALADRLISP